MSDWPMAPLIPEPKFRIGDTFTMPRRYSCFERFWRKITGRDCPPVQTFKITAVYPSLAQYEPDN